MKTRFLLIKAHVEEISFAIDQYHEQMPGRYVFVPTYEVKEDEIGAFYKFQASAQEIKLLIRCLTYYGRDDFMSKATICELTDQLIDSLDDRFLL